VARRKSPGIASAVDGGDDLVAGLDADGAVTATVLTKRRITSRIAAQSSG
jgi:hypothetical protein